MRNVEYTVLPIIRTLCLCYSMHICKFQVAIKTIKKSKIETDADLIRIRREIQIMSSVRHPNIIHIYEGNLLNNISTQ
jgi:serine/threonine protein kinase